MVDDPADTTFSAELAKPFRLVSRASASGPDRSRTFAGSTRLITSKETMGVDTLRMEKGKMTREGGLAPIQAWILGLSMVVFRLDWVWG